MTTTGTATNEKISGQSKEDCDYANPWMYKEKPFTSECIGDYYGFVYLIVNQSNGRKYIGRKYFWSKRKPRSKDQTTKRRRVTTESDWKRYYGSCPELKSDVKEYGKERFLRIILSLHRTVGKTNYEETRQLFINNVLVERDPDGGPLFYNSNILGRYMRKDYFDLELDTEENMSYTNKVLKGFR